MRSSTTSNTASDSRVDYVFGLDRGFLMPAGVAIASLRRHLSGDDRIVVLHVGLDGDDLRLLEHCAGEIELRGVDCAGRLHPAWRPPSFNSQATFYRYLAAELIPDAQRCLYLDGDVLVRRDPASVAGADLHGHTLGAVRSRPTPFVASPQGVQSWFELGIPGAAPYFNAGVLVMDLDCWRSRDVTARLTEFLVKHGEGTLFSDQEALNAVLWDDWQALDRTWNYITHVVESFLPAPEEEPDDPGIVHFAGRAKPWVFGPMPIYAEEWYQVLTSTPWAGFRPAPPVPPTGFKVGVRRVVGRGVRRLLMALREPS
jgi:lipopolysaccharide biosynthesis glycosyltransferase